MHRGNSSTRAKRENTQNKWQRKEQSPSNATDPKRFPWRPVEENTLSLILSSPPLYFVKKDRKKERGKFGSAGERPKRKMRGLENMTSEERLNGLRLGSPVKKGLRKIWLTAFKLPSFCREGQNNIFSVDTRDEGWNHVFQMEDDRFMLDLGKNKNRKKKPWDWLLRVWHLHLSGLFSID